VGAFHHSNTYPWVVNGWDGPQTWKIGANISNKQSLTADKGCSSSLWVGQRTNNSSQ